MKKKVGIFVLALLLLMSNAQVTYAHSSQKEHDADLLAVLFGEGTTLNNEQKQVFQDIADAAALCIDQFSVNEWIRTMEKSTFDPLKKRIGFSFGFDDIELVKSKVNSPNNISANTHRHYTHRGWNFPFQSPTELEFWNQRKRILTATVNKDMFGVSPGLLARIPWMEGVLFSEDACNKQCEAFCELVYYVHVLGDYERGIAKSPFSQLVPLVRPNEISNQSPALLQDLINLFPVLFEKQPWSSQNLKQDLQRIEDEADKLYRIWGEIQTQEQRDQCCELAEKVLKLLKERIPDLLKHEDFFANVFYVPKAA